MIAIPVFYSLLHIKLQGSYHLQTSRAEGNDGRSSDEEFILYNPTRLEKRRH